VKLLNSLFVLFLFLPSCINPHEALFTEVVQDHKYITVETLNAVKLSIEDDMADSNLSHEDLEAMSDLLDRLDAISEGSVAIHDYVMAKRVNEDILQQLLRSRWNRYKGEVNE
jgi:hypothetical protein